MLERLGHVFTWIANLTAILLIGGSIFAAQHDPQPGLLVGVFGAIALFVFLVGRALRYILSGD